MVASRSSLMSAEATGDTVAKVAGVAVVVAIVPSNAIAGCCVCAIAFVKELTHHPQKDTQVPSRGRPESDSTDL